MTYDLHQELVAREQAAPVGHLDVATITARAAHRRTARVATRLVAAAAGCALAFGVGQLTWNGLVAPEPPAVTAPAPARAEWPECGAAVPTTSDGSADLAAIVLPEAAGASPDREIPVDLALANRSADTLRVTTGATALYLAQQDRIVSVTSGPWPDTSAIGPGTLHGTSASARTVDCSGGQLPDGTYTVYASLDLTLEDGPARPIFTGGLPVEIVNGRLVPSSFESPGVLSAAVVGVTDDTGATESYHVDGTWDGTAAPGDTLVLQTAVVAYDRTTGTPVAFTDPHFLTVLAPERGWQVDVPVAAQDLHRIVSAQPTSAADGAGASLSPGEWDLSVVVSGYQVSGDGTTMAPVGLRTLGRPATLR